jgi:hypothetical protein
MPGVSTFRDQFAEKFRSFRQRLQGPLLCSDCFTDRGLAVEAQKLGKPSTRICPQCNSRTGVKLDRASLASLAQNFFVHGSFTRTEFGGASRLRLREGGFSDDVVRFPAWLDRDARLIEEKLGIAIFYYGPPTWRVGEIEPLHDLEAKETREAAAQDVVGRFPRRDLAAGETFYRLRKGLDWAKCAEASQYDAPPAGCGGAGRLDDLDFPVLYGSEDSEICVHECRVTKTDECYLATLEVARGLKLLDLCGDTSSDGGTPFESLYMAIQFIFAAEQHSYGIVRAIAKAARSAGLHGVAYPSYFSSLRGNKIPNIGLFGHPIAAGSLKVLCANRLLLDTVQYGVTLGPCLAD